MSLLEIKDCPEYIYKKISMNAKRQNRSINEEIIAILENGLKIEISNSERKKILLEKISRRDVSDKLKKIESETLIREDRER